MRIDQLPPRTRQVAILAATDPRPLKCLAHDVELTTGTLKKYLYNVYKWLGYSDGLRELTIEYWKEKVEEARRSTLTGITDGIAEIGKESK